MLQDQRSFIFPGAACKHAARLHEEAVLAGRAIAKPAVLARSLLDLLQMNVVRVHIYLHTFALCWIFLRAPEVFFLLLLSPLCKVLGHVSPCPHPPSPHHARAV